MAELKDTFKWLYRRTVDVLARLRGKPASLPQRQSLPRDEPIPPTLVDLPLPPSPEMPPPAGDDGPTTSIQGPPSEMVSPAPVSGAAFEGVTLPLPVVIQSDAKSPAPVSRSEQHPKSKNPSLVVYALGHFRVYCDDRLITTWRSKKGKAIFKYLLAQREHQAAKDILMDVFWPDATPEAARNDLNVAIHGLRQALRTVRPDWPFILYEDEHYVISPAIELWVDFEEYTKRYEVAAKFERDGELGRALREYERAESLYEGDFLEENLYEDWPILQRESLKDAYLAILDFLSRHYLAEKKYGGCIQFCRKMLAKDDCREDAHRRLMVCYILQGERNLALRQYETCVENLARAMDVAPMEETTALFLRIRKGSAPFEERP